MKKLKQRNDEYRDMTDAELGHALDEQKDELFKLRVQQSLGQLEKPSRMKELRREVARIETIRSARRVEREAAAAEPQP